ncbi:MAG: MBL fold metallo-hydrolase [Bacteroidales bacterium]
MIIALLIISLLSLSVYIFMQHPKFGRLPAGERLERIKESPNYKDGKFQNLRFTPDLTEGETIFTVLRDFLFTKKPRLKPIDSIPSMKTDLLNLDSGMDLLVWFGHSSYFIQIDGKKIWLIRYSVVRFRLFRLPPKHLRGLTLISLMIFLKLIISSLHDHWDHLDYETVLKLKSKINKVICGLGTGEHLEYWGFDKNRIIEKDWNEKIVLDSGFIVHTTPARHFSGRGFQRNKTLWTSFVLKTPSMNLFIGGDGGLRHLFC